MYNRDWSASESRFLLSGCYLFVEHVLDLVESDSEISMIVKLCTFISTLLLVSAINWASCEFMRIFIWIFSLVLRARFLVEVPLVLLVFLALLSLVLQALLAILSLVLQVFLALLSQVFLAFLALLSLVFLVFLALLSLLVLAFLALGLS